MKVTLCVCRYEEVEVEIDDKFQKLAVDRPWEHLDLKVSDYDECIKAVEEASGLPFGDDSEAKAFIEAAWSSESGELMLEN